MITSQDQDRVKKEISDATDTVKYAAQEQDRVKKEISDATNTVMLAVIEVKKAYDTIQSLKVMVVGALCIGIFMGWLIWS